MTDDATARNALLELLDSLEAWSRACQVAPAERELRKLKADLAADILDARSEIAALRAKLRRCHDLLQEAESFTDCDVEWRWGAAVVAELLACDEAGECPTIAAAREGEKL